MATPATRKLLLELSVLKISMSPALLTPPHHLQIPAYVPPAHLPSFQLTLTTSQLPCSSQPTPALSLTPSPTCPCFLSCPEELHLFKFSFPSPGLSRLTL